MPEPTPRTPGLARPDARAVGAANPAARATTDRLADPLAVHALRDPLLSRPAAHAPAPPARQAPTSKAVQRDPAWTDQHTDKAYDGFVTGLDGVVNKMAAAVIAAPLGIPDVDGYTGRWKTLVTAILADAKLRAAKLDEVGGDAETNTGKALLGALSDTPFIHAAYGYAVESLANASMNTGSLDSALPNGHTLSTQATRGATRPDIVTKNAGKDVGWFDITASASEAHIFNKTGSGWTTRPYVAEVTYPSLGLKDVVSIVGKAAGSGVALKDLGAALEASQKDRAARLDKLFGLVKLSLLSVEHIGNMTTRAREFEETLGALLGVKDSDGNDMKVSPSTAKSLLALVTSTYDGLGSFAKAAAAAGYKGKKNQGRDPELATEVLYALVL
ncbi:MAG: hypothetical protein Q8P41_16600 [Pseudomonadota bacterium]|nr:hypothetical protein [Pseudomonadota bacterium]